MTPLWARMLVFEAWKNKEITEECAHYFDKLILDYSKSKSVDGAEFEYSSMEDVLDKIGRKGFGEFNLLEYVEKINYPNGRIDPYNHQTDVYLFEIIKTRKDYITIIIQDALAKENLSLDNVRKIESFFDRLTATHLVSDPNHIKSINRKFANICSEIEVKCQK